jgi:hypothetical protein
MLPPAPPTFSMMMGWPRVCCILAAIIRPVISSGPPAENGTMTVIGRDG